ncbi:type II toxin-antitoxin system VapC family toxin [Aphanothece sacrum]|uniref:Twitching motility protein PilT n=1 Tax=Aphanothece sacrum FPU1 TaxID=1920663 RepID=A0A401IEB5_APHSA|nr:PIN domain-containing protein [Aphanothece sacrum]GBF79617.1 twitching motility protein PilT [Aphanothece sacrum FPU1]GBF87077.1 twitching motility protein [Aphanothece sacrum FPU3]
MRRLILDAGPLIALVSKQDNYHQEAKTGFSQLPQEFGEVLTPLPILFEVYKFVSREASVEAAQRLLTILYQETVIVPIEGELFAEVYDLVRQLVNWKGSLEDGTVIILAEKYNAEVWTLDYRDLGYFKQIRFWTPST